VRVRFAQPHIFATDPLILALTIWAFSPKKINRQIARNPKKFGRIFKRPRRPTFGGKVYCFLACWIVGVCLTPQKTVW